MLKMTLDASLRPLVMFGAGQVADAIAAYRYPAAFVVDPEYARIGVSTTERMLQDFPPDKHAFVIGLSFKGLNKIRADKFQYMLEAGYAPVTYLCPDVWQPFSCEIGAGTFVMPRNTLQACVSIGKNCMIWAGNHIGHHSKIGDHVWLSSGIVVSGGCEVGDYSFIGSGATIADNVKIGKRCIIGAGSLVLQDVPDDSVVAERGTPISKVSSARAARLLG